MVGIEAFYSMRGLGEWKGNVWKVGKRVECVWGHS